MAGGDVVTSLEPPNEGQGASPYARSRGLEAHREPEVRSTPAESEGTKAPDRMNGATPAAAPEFIARGSGGPPDRQPPGFEALAGDVSDEATVCGWFALCGRPTDKAAAHPVLGIVPICSYCAARLGIVPEYQIDHPDGPGAP